MALAECGEKEYLANNTMRITFHGWVSRWNMVPRNHINKRDVERHSFLKSRAAHEHACNIVYDGSRSLVILDDSGDCELLYLPFAIPKR